MMDDNSRKDIRALLKTFGVKADEAIVGHLAKNPDVGQLNLKVTLEDMTDYGSSAPSENLSFVVDGQINR
jgi:hypothetical protein